MPRPSEDGVEVPAVEAAVEEPSGIQSDASEHLQHGAPDEIVEVAIFGELRGVGLLPQGKVLVVVVRGLNLNGGEAGPHGLVRIAGVTNDAEIVEVLPVAFGKIGDGEDWGRR